MESVARKRLIQEYYSKRAKDYDRQKSRTWRNSQGFAAQITDELTNALAGFKKRLILEVGVGSGRDALPLLANVKPKLVGLDLSLEMLQQAKTKAKPFKKNLTLIQADAEHLPLTRNVFDAIICMSAMHYFLSTAKILQTIRATMNEKGLLVYGDLTLHETDDKGFLEKLEKTISKAHARYFKPSAIKNLIENSGFHVARMKTISYRKSYRSLMEDKGEYFNVSPEQLTGCIQTADAEAKKRYGLTDTELTLHYTMIVATKK
jgi:ubiquinone/menaquinone biosynthesis C-methylase UbiE